SGRVIPLEACRGIAAMIVVIHHYVLSFAPQTSNALRGTLGFIAINGHAAVTFFFVLSGYVLTNAYFRSEDPAVLRLALVKRWPRLAGPVVVTVLASYLCFAFGLYYFRAAGALSGSNWLIEFCGVGLTPQFQPGLWDALVQGVTVFVTGQAYYDGSLWSMQP